MYLLLFLLLFLTKGKFIEYDKVVVGDEDIEGGLRKSVFFKINRSGRAPKKLSC